MADQICQIHGPYDASLGQCPFCARQAGGTPQDPGFLDPDAIGTEIPRNKYGGGGGTPDSDTQPPRRDRGNAGGGPDGWPEEAETRLPNDGGKAWGGGKQDDLGHTQVDPYGSKAPQKNPIGYLIVKVGPRRGKVFTLDQEVIVMGRTEGDITINDAMLSNPHARFRLEGNKFTVFDFDTTNGTMVNEDFIKKRTVLKENDEIKVGNTTFVFKFLP